jgi:hypothetical protein
MILTVQMSIGNRRSLVAEPLSAFVGAPQGAGGTRVPTRGLLGRPGRFCGRWEA